VNNYSIENLTQEQYKLIMEAILFSTCPFIDSSWYRDDVENLREILIEMRKKHPSILIENVSIHKEYEDHDLFSKEMVDFFPEIINTIVL
jgi:flavodoxin